MVVQGGDLRVGASIGEINQMPVAFLTQTLTGIKIPAEKCVDHQGCVGQALCLVGRQEIVTHTVTVMQWCTRVIIDETELRPKSDAADEGIVRYYAFLQVHDPGAALVIGIEQFLAFIDGSNTNPGAAIVRFHIKRVADLITNFAPNRTILHIWPGLI